MRNFAVLLFVLMPLAMSAGQAADLYVDGDTGTDGGDCQNAGAPCETIAYAIAQSAGGDMIQIADAVYTENLAIDHSLILQGESRENTVIQAHASPVAGDITANTPVIYVSGGDFLTVTDLTLRHGAATHGGGIFIQGVDLTLERVLFHRNAASGRGGGLYNRLNTLVMSEVELVENESGRGTGVADGGGVYCYGTSGQPVEMNLTDVVFNSNTARVGGGGMSLAQNCEGALTRVEFTGNVSSEGGGGGLSNTYSSPVLRDVVFRGNRANNGCGGGMLNGFDAAPELTNVVFSGNFADSHGGALCNNSGTALVRRLTNVTISGNRAGNTGGGIHYPNNMEIRNTIIWNNRDESGTGTVQSAMSSWFDGLIVDASLIQGYAQGDFDGGSGSLNGTSAANNPKFAAGPSPGGAPTVTGNLRLKQGSPAIDAGNNTFVSGIGTDLDQLPRIRAGTVDLGPYEHGNNTLFSDRFEQ